MRFPLSASGNVSVRGYPIRRPVPRQRLKRRGELVEEDAVDNGLKVIDPLLRTGYRPAVNDDHRYTPPRRQRRNLWRLFIYALKSH